MEKHVSFTEQEANDLIALIDIAVKSGGIRVAGAGLTFVQKLNMAFNQQLKKEVTENALTEPEVEE